MVSGTGLSKLVSGTGSGLSEWVCGTGLFGIEL